MFSFSNSNPLQKPVLGQALSSTVHRNMDLPMQIPMLHATTKAFQPMAGVQCFMPAQHFQLSRCLKRQA
jgi:hypothetical protein